MANQVAYGFFNLKDVFAKRVTEVGVSVVQAAIEATVTEHNRQLAALTALFVERTTDFKRKYRNATAARLQSLDESGRARPTRLNVGSYDLAWPLQMAGGAWGRNFVTGEKMTVGEANDEAQALMTADARWVRDHILAALFTNAAWTFEDDQHGTLTVKGLANNDTDTYLIQTGAEAGVADTHYLAQAAAIADGANNPFAAIKTELTEHPENSGSVVALNAPDLTASIRALTNFEEAPDPNIRPGANTAQLVGSLGVAVPGEVYGYVDGVWVSEWKGLPANYLIALTTGGDRALAMREDSEASLQGFRQVGTRQDHPFYESQWIRRAGFGALNRVGALAYRVGNAAYAIPANYTSPMP